MRTIHEKRKNVHQNENLRNEYVNRKGPFRFPEYRSRQRANLQRDFADVKQGFEKVLEELNLKGTNAIFGRIPKDELFLK